MENMEIYISTRSTSMPHGSVAKSSVFLITPAIDSRSVNNSDRFFVPKTFLSVEAANKLVEL